MTATSSIAAPFTVGDTAKALTGQCKDGTIPAPLTGATAVDLHIRKPSGTVITRGLGSVPNAVTITDPPLGKWSYPWATGDLDEAGRWFVETQVTFSNGLIQTFGPDAFPVRPQYA
jgi:hypothetical protein